MLHQRRRYHWWRSPVVLNEHKRDCRDNKHHRQYGYYRDVQYSVPTAKVYEQQDRREHKSEGRQAEAV